MTSALASLAGLPSQAMFKLLDTQETYDRQRKIYEAQPEVDRIITNVTEKIFDAESVEDLLNDPHIKEFMLQAYSLSGELAESTQFMKRILTDPLDGEDALAYKMSDPRFLKMATDLRLDIDMSKVKDPVTLAFMMEQYKTVGMEIEVGEADLAVREAMYFKRKASEIETGFQVLADNALRAFALGALGLPQEIAYLEIDKQNEILERELDLSKLGAEGGELDEEYVDRLITQYFARNGSQGGASGGFAAGIASTIQPVTAGFDATGSFTPQSYSFDINLLV